MQYKALARLLLLVCLLNGIGASQSREDIRAARVKPLEPKLELPAWADWNKLQAGMAFSVKHRGRIGLIWGTTCLFETLGTMDAAPMFAATGVIEKDVQRGRRTAREFAAMMAQQSSLEEFRNGNYVKARSLGAMHLAMADAEFARQQQWDVSQRRPFNQQAYAMVIHTFSYRPLKILIQQGQVDPVTDRSAIEGWLHLWTVLANGMGLNAEQLAPWDWETAQRRDALLRAEQLLPSDGKVAEAILLAELGRSKARILSRNTQASEEQARAQAIDTMLSQVRLSEGLDSALGLAGEQARNRMLSWQF